MAARGATGLILGLASMFCILSLHTNHAAQVRSAYPNCADDEEAIQAAEQWVGLQHRAVLIVEDDAELRSSLTAALLEDEQLDTIECESAEPALAVMLIGGQLGCVASWMGSIWRTR